MITTKIESEKWLTILLGDFFASDEDLLTKYHARAGEGIAACVSYDFEQMTEKGSTPWVVTHNGLEVALFCFSEEAIDDEAMIDAFARSTGYDLPGGVARTLCFFMVKPEFRKREFMQKIWDEVQKVSGGEPFLVGIRERNEPATKFYRKASEKWLGKFPDVKNQGQDINLFLVR